MTYSSNEHLQNTEKDAAVKKEEKINEFRRIKERFAFITHKKEKTQDAFDQYLTSLFDNEQCKYKTGIKEIVSLCNNTLFECKFRSRDNFNFKGRLKFECQREKMLRLRKLV